MSIHENKTVINVTKEYERAEKAASEWSPGEQPDIAKLMRSAYMHGYVAGHRDGVNGRGEP